jgi:DNA polymerase-3 subunit gamma/tau
VSGLASHFRDLLVSKTPSTLSLLVGEQLKKYALQAQKCSQDFLLKGTIANDCDLKFKLSQNQRLLVELCLMQLALSLLMEKKKLTPIIPPTYFRKMTTQ